MQQIGQAKGKPGGERLRVEAIVERLANLSNHEETVAEVAHEARNMVTTLGLYCDLLEEPGVLGAPFAHYGSELRQVAAASRRLIEKLVEIDYRAKAHDSVSLASSPPAGDSTAGSPALLTPPADPSPLSARSQFCDSTPAMPIDNLASELLGNRNLLSSISGPGITLTAETQGGARPVRLTGEDLTRVLINLVKNASEAMPCGGRIRISLHEQKAAGAEQKAAGAEQKAAGAEQKDAGAEQKAAGAGWLTLTVEDNGPGIPEENLETIFASGFRFPAKGAATIGGWPSTHRGLGLAITRSIVEAAGGRITAANCSQGGARLTVELPVSNFSTQLSTQLSTQR